MLSQVLSHIGGVGFRGLGVEGLGFKGLGFRGLEVQGFWGFGIRVWGPCSGPKTVGLKLIKRLRELMI